MKYGFSEFIVKILKLVVRSERPEFRLVPFPEFPQIVGHDMNRAGDLVGKEYKLKEYNERLSSGQGDEDVEDNQVVFFDLLVVVVVLVDKIVGIAGKI